jgi:succinyl-CoA:(S)-malate CoA-transferase subunit A/succinyl-CoA:(S)-malate CoA-transferase subunit B
MGADDRPLAGVRVLDLATFVAAPYCAAVLGEFGAEVIKVEKPGEGDPLRRFGTPAADGGDTLMWLSEARNKKSITLDLRRPEGARVLKRLAAVADVVCENFRPGTLEAWGLGYDDLGAVNGGLIMLRISGYGQTGPYRERPGFARTAHAFGGLAYLSGMPDGPPVTPGSTTLADYMSGLYGALGVLLALRARDASGRGQVIDIGLYEPILRVLDELAPAYQRTGFVRQRMGPRTVNAAPHSHYPCADGGWVAIACTTDKMFARLAEVMGRPELADDDAFGRAAVRCERIDEIERIVTEWTVRLERDEVLARCLEGGAPCAPINSIADIFADPQVAARGNLARVRDPRAGEVVVPSVVPRLTATPGGIASLGPTLGAHNREVYGGLLKMSDDEIAKLEEAGVI